MKIKLSTSCLSYLGDTQKAVRTQQQNLYCFAIGRRKRSAAHGGKLGDAAEKLTGVVEGLENGK